MAKLWYNRLKNKNTSTKDKYMSKQGAIKDGQSVIAQIEQLYKDVAGVRGKEMDSISALACKYTCDLIQGVMDSMSLPPAAPVRNCPVCEDWLFDGHFDATGEPVDHPDYCPTCDGQPCEACT